MNKKNLFFSACLFVCSNLLGQTEGVSLDGKWAYRLDPNSLGQTEAWFKDKFTDELNLPGSLNTNGIGDEVSVNTPWTGSMWNRTWYKSESYKKYRDKKDTKVVFWLSPDKYYVGQTWYQKEVTIPKGWKRKSISLKLERCHWETSLWVDGKKIGSENSLSVPHCYSLDGLKPGKHVLTVCVDNRVKDIEPGPDAHSVSDNTQSNWNGIIGDLSLKARPVNHISSVRIEPLIHEKKIRASFHIKANQNIRNRAHLNLQVSSNGTTRYLLPEMRKQVSLHRGMNVVEVVYDMSQHFKLWDEFHPYLYELSASLETSAGTDVYNEEFGLRKIGVRGSQITINDRPIFFRGTLECCIFPKTGFPPTDEAAWKRIMEITKAHGLNHLRFHSWCPPEAAFKAADKVGVYLYVECGAWAHDIGSGKPIDKFIYDESRKIVKEYGNHPSFCLMSYGNEPGGKQHKEYLTKFVNYWKERDNRFLYTTASGWPAVDENDWHCLPRPRIQGWGQGIKSIINASAPNSMYDWTDKIVHDKPTISHEIGQWCVYPDLKERSQYTGVLKAKNFDIFEDRLRDNKLVHLADSFLLASGKLQTLCYKADIEAALRTKGFGGFQLLDLHDFPGQGSALVGVLNPFWESKGYVTPTEYKEFCNEVVPLARMPRFVYTSGDTLKADIEIAQYSAVDFTLPVRWKIVAANGRLIEIGSFPACNLPTGTLTSVGCIEERVEVELPEQWQLEVSVGGFKNRWNIWVYPSEIEKADDILVASSLNEDVIQKLEQGGKVLLTPQLGMMKNEKKDSVVVGFSSIFWNTLWTNGQAPHTLGILCNPDHPALKLFPTKYHSDYQWWDAMAHSNAIPLRKLGIERPIVRIIDDWFTARSLGLIVEMKVAKGSLMFCGADLLKDVDKRPEARQLMTSLLSYMKGDAFNPTHTVSIEQLKECLK